KIGKQKAYQKSAESDDSKKETNLGRGDIGKRSKRSRKIVFNEQKNELDQKEKTKMNNMPKESDEVADLRFRMIMKVKLDENDDFADLQKGNSSDGRAIMVDFDVMSVESESIEQPNLKYNHQNSDVELDDTKKQSVIGH
ncbi:5834_t:CDS:2, partial [Dentiscutata erythropus]